MTNITSEVRFRLIKIMDMGYMVILYFILGIVLSKLTDLALTTHETKDEIKKKTTLRLIIEIIITIWTNMIVFYIARNVMQLVPSPFDGLYGYDHSRLKEVTNTAVLGVTYLYFQSGLRDNLNELNVRLSISKNIPANSDFF